ncbi:MAG: hypothetical protein ACLPKB_01600 [Xanthobacteraceae bacterium]
MAKSTVQKPGGGFRFKTRKESRRDFRKSLTASQNRSSTRLGKAMKKILWGRSG